MAGTESALRKKSIDTLGILIRINGFIGELFLHLAVGGSEAATSRS